MWSQETGGDASANLLWGNREGRTIHKLRITGEIRLTALYLRRPSESLRIVANHCEPKETTPWLTAIGEIS